MEADPQNFPPLREEIALHPGPSSKGGFPTWTLHDPPRNQFFRIGWLEFEILSRWTMGNSADIATSITLDTTLKPKESEVEAFVEHLKQNHLTQPQTDQDQHRFITIQQKNQQPLGQWMLQNYLFMRIPLWHPDLFLKRTFPWIRWLFTEWFALLIVINTLFGLGLLMQQWDTFTTTFLHFFNFSGMLYYGGAFILSKTVHELGHAYTAHRFGCRVPTIGVALLVMWPVLYTETSEVWKLSSQKQRLAVGMAGMLAELGLASLATVAWSFLADGPMKSAAFLLASTLWILSLVINLNPLMRFDGYFLLSDTLEIPNLQNRSFAYARWWLREKLFGFNLEPPELFSKAKQRFLIVFAFCVWIYRLFLFLAIALLVYHFFFKLLGLFLYLVEIIWFVVKPVGNEMVAWFRYRKLFQWNRYLFRTFFIVGIVLTWLVLPWSYTITSTPALLQALHHTTLYAPAAAKVKHIHVKPGQHVDQGDALFNFENPELQYRLQSIQRDINLNRWKLTVQEMAVDSLDQDRTLQQTLDTLQSQQQTVLAEQKKLLLTAPFSGTVVDLALDVMQGDWISKGEPLMTLIDKSQVIIKGYIPEADLRLIPKNAEGIFYPEHPDTLPLSGHLIRVDQTTTQYLSEPDLASVYGGDLPVRTDQKGNLVIEGSFYRGDLSPKQDFTIDHISRGYLSINTHPESLLSRLWRTVHATLIRESGF